MDTALQIHVRKILRAIAAANAAEEAKIRKAEADGYRVVDGGGFGDGGWEVHDWRTGERLASGSGGHDEYDAVVGKLDPEGRWWHVDKISHTYHISPTEGIPPTLAAVLVDWAETAPAEEIDQVVG